VDTNGPFQFQKGRQLFIRSHNEAVSIAAMRVNNPDRSAFGIDGSRGQRKVPFPFLSTSG
jgi:hypothetical protein